MRAGAARFVSTAARPGVRPTRWYGVRIMQAKTIMQAPCRTGRSAVTAGLAIVALAVALATTPSAVAQQPVNPVYVDDSPRAWELFQRAMDQREDNLGETVRAFQELLDDYSERLLPARAGQPDHLISVRRRVMDALHRDPALLERYRQIQEPHAARLFEAGDLDRLVRTRALTPSGLRGQLRLAQQHLEAGAFNTALRVLEEARTQVTGNTIGLDPEQQQRDRRYAWYMTGVAAWYVGNDLLAMDARANLEAEGGTAVEPFVARLSELMAEAVVDQRLRSVTSDDRFDHFDPSQLVSKPIWTIDLPDTLLGRRYSDRDLDTDPASPDVARTLGRFLTVAPTLADSTVYINEGHIVRAIDRYSHRERWRYIERPRTAIADNDREIAGDLNTVVVTGDAAVTLTGHAHTDLRSSSGKVICLDRETGEYRWRVVLGEITGSELHEGLFPHGTPVIDDGRVYVVARRVSRQNVTSTYVAALRLEDGALEWMRHIASSGGLRQNIARPFSALASDEGTLFVETAVGAVASLDATTGDIRWLRRYAVPLSPPSRSREPWEYSAPVVTPAGLIALRYSQTLEVVVYDKDTGDVRAARPAGVGTAWGNVRYMLANGPWVYAIGRDVRAFHTDDLTSPAWIFPDDIARDSFVGDSDNASTADVPPLQVFGRVQVGEQMLVVPSLHGQYLLGIETGRIVRRVRDAFGNPLIADGQLFVAGPLALSSYMPLHVAESMIRQRMAQAAGNPEPALTLLELGLRADDLALVLEGAEAAETIIDAITPPGGDVQQRWRSRLFELLLEAHERQLPGATAPDGPAADLYAMLRTHAAGDDGEVEYRLAYADWLDAHDPEAAVAQLQHILASPTLARRPRAAGDIARPAAAWAVDALTALIDQHGHGVYAAQRGEAERDLTAMLADPSVEQLLDIADTYPLAPAAVTAIQRAADVARQRDGERAAVAVLLRGYHIVADARPDDSARLFGGAVESYLAANMPHAAVDLLEWAGRHAPGGRLIGDAGARHAGSWRDAILARAGGPRPGDARPIELPRLVAQPRELPGRMLMPLHQDSLPRANARMLTYEGNLLRLVDLGVRPDRGGDADAETVWSMDVAPPIDVLSFNDRTILLALNPHTVDPRVVALDARTGRERWITPRLSNVLDDAERMLQPLRGAESFGETTLPDGRPFDIREALTLLDESNVYLVRRTGSVAAFSRETGELRWSQDDVLHHMHIATAHPCGLALSGIVQEPADDRRSGDMPVKGRLVVLDPMTGRTITAMTPLDHWPARWMDMTPLGALIYRCESGLEAIDMLSGRVLWSNTTSAARQSTRTWRIDDWVMVADEDNTIRTVDGQRGTIREIDDTALTGNPKVTGPARAMSGTHGTDWNRSPLVDVLPVERDALVHFRERLVRIDRHGRIVGADFIMDNRQFRFVVQSGDRLLLVNQLRSEQRELDNGAGRLTVYPYMLHILNTSGRLLSEIGVESFAQPVREVAIENNWLLLGTQQSVYVLPLTRERQ